MSVEIKVPVLPESVADAVVAKWYKQVGDTVERDENLVDLETDKVMLEVPAPQSGVIEKLFVQEGATVEAEQVIAEISPGEAAAKPQSKENNLKASSSAPASAQEQPNPAQSPVETTQTLSPSARRLAQEKDLDASKAEGSGKGGRVTKQDLTKLLQKTEGLAHQAAEMVGGRTEERVPMSRLRARIAQRLVQVQQDAALLTTFNEINMKPVMDLRKKYKDQFEKVHGVRLGFMSFFTRAAVEALQRFPVVNASIDGNDLIYHNFCDIGIAVGSERGLVVPILRNTENMSLSEIEKQIRGFAEKANKGKVTIEEMTGGTFTITNGGTYGSMLSTPIINPPQTAILGMHNIVERPVAENGEVVIRPVMYVALSYDHRVIDGREAVLFLRTIKDSLEDPARLLLGV